MEGGVAAAAATVTTSVAPPPATASNGGASATMAAVLTCAYFAVFTGCLGDAIYRSITDEDFDPLEFLEGMDLSTEHKVLDLKNRIEASTIIWKRKMQSKDTKSSWGSIISFEKREQFEKRDRCSLHPACLEMQPRVLKDLVARKVSICKIAVPFLSSLLLPLVNEKKNVPEELGG